MDNRPTHFYRYRSLSNGAMEFVRKTLLEDQLFFSAPSTFNDPFDCYPSFEFAATNEEIASYYAGVIRRNSTQLTEEQIMDEARAMLVDPERNPRNPDFLNSFQDLHVKHIKEKIGVLCLSEVYDDILMWSHYADFHRGVCFQFDGSSQYFANVHRVNYLPDRPKINPFLQSTEEMMDAGLLAKARQWSYEKEWRLMRYKLGPGISIVPAEALVGVVLGARISPQDEKTIVELVKARRAPTKILRASVSRYTYSLEFE